MEPYKNEDSFQSTQEEQQIMSQLAFVNGLEWQVEESQYSNMMNMFTCKNAQQLENSQISVDLTVTEGVVPNSEEEKKNGNFATKSNKPVVINSLD